MKRFGFFMVLVIFGIQLSAQTTGKLNVSVATSSTGGNYAPRNIVAIWIEDSNGNYVKTLLAYADRRMTHLNNWETSSTAKGVKFDVTDAVTGATRSSHGTRTCTWNGTDYNKNLLADGTYSLCMELTDKNNTGNYSQFSFVKGENNEVTPSDVSSFSSISIKWEATSTAILSEISRIDDVEIFPNPIKNVFRVEGENIDEIEVWNISGKFILKNNYSKEIDLSNYEDGVYLVRIKRGSQTIIKKVLKKSI